MRKVNILRKDFCTWHTQLDQVRCVWPRLLLLAGELRKLMKARTTVNPSVIEIVILAVRSFRAILLAKIHIYKLFHDGLPKHANLKERQGV